MKKRTKRQICWVITLTLILSMVMLSSPVTAMAAYGSVSIHQGVDKGDNVELIERNITRYYPQSGPLVVQVSSIFTDIAADNAQLVITNSANQIVYSDTGKKYFLQGSFALYGLKNLPVGNYRVKLIWGALDLGTDGYKDFTIVKGVHPDAPDAPPRVPVTGVKLNRTSYSMNKGDKMQLTATVSPSTATDKSVTWTSDNTKAATVDSTGKVTAKGNGSANITATTDDGGKKASCKVTVKTPAKSLTLNKTGAVIKKGKTVQLSVASYNPASTYPKAITWKSSNTSIVKVDKKGLVTGVKAGTAYIYAKAWNGVFAKCKIVVKN